MTALQIGLLAGYTAAWFVTWIVLATTWSFTEGDDPVIRLRIGASAALGWPVVWVVALVRRVRGTGRGVSGRGGVR